MNKFTIFNDYREDRLSKIDPSNIHIFYININGLDIKNSDYSLLQFCQIFQEKRVDFVSITETNVSWRENISLIVSKKYFTKHGPKIIPASAPLNST